MKSGKHFGQEVEINYLDEITIQLRSSHSWQPPQHPTATTVQETKTSWKVAEVEILSSSSLFMLVPQILHFCLELKKEKNVLSSLILWRTFGNTNPLLKLLFLSHSTKVVAKKNPVKLSPLLLPVPINKVLISLLSRSHLNANIRKHRQGKKTTLKKRHLGWGECKKQQLSPSSRQRCDLWWFNL